MPTTEDWSKRASDLINGEIEALSYTIMRRHFERHPELLSIYGEREKAFYIRDSRYNLAALAASILFLTPGVFADHMAWVVRLLNERGIPTRGLPTHIECMMEILQETLPDEVWANIAEYVEAGLEASRQQPPGTPPRSEEER